MTDSAFTGERLHDQDALFAIDLIRHRAAYRHAAEHVAGRRTVEFGSGSGYGAAELAAAGIDLVCLDRIASDRTHRDSGACFVRADLRRAPIAAGRFGAALSFQVIEHLEDPEPYLSAITRSLRDIQTDVKEADAMLLSDELAKRLDRMARRAYRAMHLRGYGRIDLRVTDEGRIVVLEVNANPELAWGDDFSASAEKAGIDYDALIQRIVNLGLRGAGQ